MRRFRSRRGHLGRLSALAAALAAAAPLTLAAQRPEIYHAIGCVGRAGTAYTITDTRADPPIVYRLQYDEKELDFQVGHTVEVSGPLLPGDTMKVESLIWISNTCIER
jgi:hypothetical protein